MTAEEWYKEFYQAYKDYAKKHQSQANKALASDAKWSDLMEKVLSTLAKSLSYEHTGKLRGAPGVDIRWRKPGNSVAIEHENRGDQIYIEIANLC